MDLDDKIARLEQVAAGIHTGIERYVQAFTRMAEVMSEHSTLLLRYLAAVEQNNAMHVTNAAAIDRLTATLNEQRTDH